MVIGDIVDVARGVHVIGSQHEALYNIGDVAEWQVIIAAPDNNALAIFHPLGHTTKVQAVSGAKETTWTKNDGLDLAVQHEASHQTITLRFRDAIWVGIGPQSVFFRQETPKSQAINTMRTGMDEAAHTCRLSRFIEIS